MTTRLCARCEREKSIRGVWYLTPPPQAAATPFVCETCYVERPLEGGMGAPIFT